MYEVTIRIQDDDSADYLCPYEFRTDSLRIAQQVRDELLADEVGTRQRVMDFLGIEPEQYERDGIWLQVFLTDTEHDYEDEDEYWMSYDVI